MLSEDSAARDRSVSIWMISVDTFTNIYVAIACHLTCMSSLCSIGKLGAFKQNSWTGIFPLIRSLSFLPTGCESIIVFVTRICNLLAAQCSLARTSVTWPSEATTTWSSLRDALTGLGWS